MKLRSWASRLIAYIKFSITTTIGIYHILYQCQFMTLLVLQNFQLKTFVTINLGHVRKYMCIVQCNVQFSISFHCPHLQRKDKVSWYGGLLRITQSTSWLEGRNNNCDWIPLPQKRGILKSRQWQSSKILFTIHSVKWNDIFHQYWKFQVWAQVFNLYAANHDSALVVKRCTFY